MSTTTLKSLDSIKLRECCTIFASTFSSDGSSDVDLNDLISELYVLQLTLTDKPITAMEIFEYVRELDCYPNVSIAYQILFTKPVAVASAERACSKRILCIEKKLLDEIDIDTIIIDFVLEETFEVIYTHRLILMLSIQFKFLVVLFFHILFIYYY